jgi:hypothetical protein
MRREVICSGSKPNSSSSASFFAMSVIIAVSKQFSALSALSLLMELTELME